MKTRWIKKPFVALLTLLILLGLAVLTASTSARPQGEGGTAQEGEAEDLERFVPSEEVSADGAISFPVDI